MLFSKRKSYYNVHFSSTSNLSNMAHNNKMIEWWYGFYISQLIRYSTDCALHSDFSGQSSAAEAKATQAKLRCVNVEVIVTKQFYCRLHISYFGGVRVAHRFCFLCCFLLLLLLLFGMSLFGVLLLLLLGMSLFGVLWPMCPVSLSCPFLICPSVFSNINFNK